MRKLYLILFVVMLACMGCEWRLRSSDDQKQGANAVTIERFDRMESLFLTTGDLAALQQLQIHYPVETRMLIEDVLQLGQVNDADINSRFLLYFQDSTLQSLIADVEASYASMGDLDSELGRAFRRLQTMLPAVEVPRVYAQIGSLDQSIVVGHGTLGNSLDKYLGADHPLYVHYDYTPRQRSMMTRDNIVPDCLSFYLLSLYPLSADTARAATLGAPLRQAHMGKIHYVVNQAMRRTVFKGDDVRLVQRYVHAHRGITAAQLLAVDDYDIVRR